jgi:glycosyltransferase involved in cell wall biosynthesis
VCFVAPKAYPALSGREDLAHVGGAERQQVLLAEELVRRGHRVSFVVLDHDQSDGEVIRGIRLFKCYRRGRGVRGLRFFHPRLSGLWAAMNRADADLYYQRGAEAETGLVAHWCRRHARAFLFAVAHDTNCTPRSLLMSRSERLLFRYGLRRANAIVVQTSRQQALLRREFGLESTIVQSCISLWWNAEHAEQVATGAATNTILWVGRFSEEKRAEWVIQLAQELPECRFSIVGDSNFDSAFTRTLMRQIESLPNVKWYGYVPHQRMPDLYRQARLLLCTSKSEGVPNVFLEAWSCGKGVLSTVDPDNIITRFQTGHVATNYDEIKQYLMELDQRRPAWELAGCRGRQYVRLHHDVNHVTDTLVQVINNCTVAAAEAGTPM